MKNNEAQIMPKTTDHPTLSSLASIRAGFTFREKVNEAPNGNARILQIKDLRRQQDNQKSSVLTATNLPAIKWEGASKAALLPDSIVVPARGEYTKASYIKAELVEAPIIVSSQFLIVTPNKEKVSTAYLCWVINQPAAQHFLAQESRGTNIPMLNTKSLGQLKIPLPSIRTQRQIVELQQLWEQEQQLTQALLNNRQTMLTGMFQQLLKEDHQ